ncbi:MAG: hypothetical protein ABEI75_00935 [Halobaculum sp.]
MSGRNEERTAESGDETELERRTVLSGMGGGFTAAVGTQIGRDDGMGLIDRVRWKIETARLSRRYGDLGGPETDPAELVAELDESQRSELAAAGRRLYTLGGDCGPEGYEVDGGKYDTCCTIHDNCCAGQSTAECIGNETCWAVFGACVAIVS